MIGNQLEDYKHIEALTGAVNSGVRRLFSVITKNELYEQVGPTDYNIKYLVKFDVSSTLNKLNYFVNQMPGKNVFSIASIEKQF